MSTASTVVTRGGTVAGRVVGERLAWLGRWCGRHRRWLALWLVVAAVSGLAGSRGPVLWPLAVGLAPGLAAMLWGGLAPRSYEVLLAAPSRRMAWWWYARRRWRRLARVCGLSDRQVVGSTRTAQGRAVEAHRWVAPRLRRVRTRAHSVELTVRARAGQTLAELETGAERLATTFGALAYRVWPASGAAVVVELVMLDLLRTSSTAREPEPRAVVESVRLGRCQSGRDWRLQLRGRHTLVAGCSGSGKGSVLWGVCCGLAPAVRADLVRLWGIDLKRGVELAMGEALFSTRAYRPADALEVLGALMAVIDERGEQMAGTTRLHQPMAGDPLHVLVIDELAALTAYADLEIRREANRMLAEILTQGRALGVVVVACVQDPRKEVVAMRGLFTQTIALRLRSVEETVMVLGDGMSARAPAHRISPTYPGTGWVVEDTGAADRVRADYWPDPLIREVSRRYATEVHLDTHPDPDMGTAGSTEDADSHERPAPAPRASRKPRAPRQPRQGQGRQAPRGEASGAGAT